jgi:hypothetical protein
MPLATLSPALPVGFRSTGHSAEGATGGVECSVLLPRQTGSGICDGDSKKSVPSSRKRRGKSAPHTHELLRVRINTPCLVQHGAEDMCPWG